MIRESSLSFKLDDLRRAALHAVARREKLPSEKWQLDRALQEISFGQAIDVLRSYVPWYSAGYGRILKWLSKVSGG